MTVLLILTVYGQYMNTHHASVKQFKRLTLKLNNWRIAKLENLEHTATKIAGTCQHRNIAPTALNHVNL